MVVVAIIAIIAAGAIPSLYGYVHKEGFRKTVSDVLDVCRTARAEAIIRGEPAQLVFHPRDGTCEVSSSGGGYGAWAHSAKFEHCTISMLDVNLREFKDADSATVRFFPNGRCDEMTLVLHSDNNEWRTITLEVTTGLVTMSSGLPLSKAF
jgi:Tfp pilus assembly protein FimT